MLANMLSRAFLSLLVLSFSAQAQNSYGRFTGRITDQQGSAIVGARVKITHTDTNTTAQTATNHEGVYDLLNQLPGPYVLQVEFEGFKQHSRSGLVLRVGDILELNVQLEIGAVSDSVSVTAEAPILETGTASLGNVKSMHNAAVIASGNELGAPDYKRAYKWFSLAAAHGLKDSQFNLAVLLERGLGTEANKADAWFWYSICAQQDDQDAKARAAQLAKQLTQSELLAAKTRLAAWKPDTAPDAANIVAINSSDWQATAQN